MVAAAAAVSIAGADESPGSAGAPEVYAKDVEFLLDELPKRAGHLIALKKIDWGKVESEFREAVKSVRTDTDHVVLCTRLLARLRDGHAAVVDAKVKPPDESNGRRWTGPRVHLGVAGAIVFVRAAFGRAADAGLKPGQTVLRIDGRPAREWLERRVAEMRDRTGYSTDHQALYAACHWGLADWEGTPIKFDVCEADGSTRSATITRSGGPNFAPIGPVFPPKELQSLGRQRYGRTAGGFGYIHLRDVPSDLPAQLDTMLDGIGDVPGLILDFRGNGGGGCDHAEVFGRFLAPGAYWGAYEGKGARPFAGPMVVIVDAGVRSAGETLAGLFKEERRAYVIGDTPTAGMSSQKVRLPLPSGLCGVYFSVRSNMGRYNERHGIEGIGIPPFEVVPYDPAELAGGRDTLIRRAEELLEKGFPGDEVDYVPPSKRVKDRAGSGNDEGPAPANPPVDRPSTQ
jgi:C-terminal processing protease CtpA/Prc